MNALRPDVELAPAPPPAVDADQQSQRRGGQGGGRDQEHRGPDALADHGLDVLTLEEERVPEVEREGVLRVDEELLRERPVQPKLVRDPLHVLGVERTRPAQQERRGIARDDAEQEEVEDHDEGEGEQRLQHLANDVSARPHSGSSTRLPLASRSRSPRRCRDRKANRHAIQTEVSGRDPPANRMASAHDRPAFAQVSTGERAVRRRSEGLRARTVEGGSRGLGSVGTETVAGRTGGMDGSASRPRAMEPSGSCHQSLPVDATDDRHTHLRLCPHLVHLDGGAKQGRLRAAGSPDERACAARGQASPHVARSYQPAHRDHHQGSAELVARVEPPARWDARGHPRSGLDAIPDAPRM